VDRGPHQRRLNDLASLQRSRQRRALEALDARPEADVHRWRVLRLDAGELLERRGQRQVDSIEQPLAGEQRAVELLSAERSHRTSVRYEAARLLAGLPQMRQAGIPQSASFAAVGREI
jgi:hypothetical protein